MSDEGSGAVRSERRFRMTLDFRVLIGDVGEGDIKEGDGGEHRREHTGRQRRLLRTLLRDEVVLREFMTYLVTDRVCGHADSELGKVFGVREQEEMLEPVYAAMSEEDARFYREVREADVFWENTERFECSFGVEWTGARLVEVGWEREGETTLAGREADMRGKRK